MIFLFLIILGGILEYLIDIKTAPKGYYDKCINNTGFHVKLLFHHIIVIFIFFGWLSNNKYVLLVYLVVPIILIIHWKKNNNRCIMTETVNNMCKLDKNEYIRDFLYLIGLKQSNYYDVIYKTFLLFSFTVVCYKLIKKNN